MTQEKLATNDQLLKAATGVLVGIAGPGATPRPDQLHAARAVACEGQRALVVQATGWGKSAVYWIAARALRDAGAGLTLVVSPLLALMRNQVEAAERAGLRAATLNSSNFEDWGQIKTDLAAGRIDVLLTSPERLANPQFAQEVIPWLLPQLGLLVIDEAHCISSWGHDFRPDYRRITGLLLSRPELAVLATTATANARVTSDVAAQLGQETLVLRGTLARESLHLSVIPDLSLLEAYAWVGQFLKALPESGIIYAATVRMVTDLTAYLLSRGDNVRAYHGKLSPDEREEIEGALKSNALKAVIATSALGMGYDKPDLGFVVHVGSPASPVDYYQQVGRAGRALDSALVVLIPTPVDEELWHYFATASIPREQDARNALDALSESGPTSVPKLAALTGIRDSRLELILKVLAVEEAVKRTTTGWESTNTTWVYDSERYTELIAARKHEADLMRTYARSLRCLDSVLREALDDPAISECGRCSACMGQLPSGIEPAPDHEHVVAATQFIRGIENELPSRSFWAPNMPWSGKINRDLSFAEGRALAYGNDPVWPEVADLLRKPDAPAPDWLAEAMVALMVRWKETWPARPTVVVPAPSTSHRELVMSLAIHIGRLGNLPVLEALAISGEPSDKELAAKARGAFQSARLSPRHISGISGQIVLLVDDAWNTGWTTTISAAILRQGGASMVLPLIAHHRP